MIPLAEKAIISGSADEVHEFLSDALRTQLSHRLDHVMALASRSGDSGPHAGEAAG